MIVINGLAFATGLAVIDVDHSVRFRLSTCPLRDNARGVPSLEHMHGSVKRGAVHDSSLPQLSGCSVAYLLRLTARLIACSSHVVDANL
jgi:hypothetical protein